VGEAAPTARADRVVQLAPFALVALAPLAMAPFWGVDRPWCVAASVTLTLVTAATIVFVPWDRLASGLRAGPVALYALAVALARHGERGSAPSLVLLLLLPVLFQALYSRRRDLFVAVALTSLAIATPVVAAGPPDYPASEWAVVVLWSLVATVTGLVTNDLVHRLRRGEETLTRIATVAHGLTTAGDNRETICRAALDLGAADLVYLFEPAAEHLISTATAGLVAPPLEIPLAGEVSATVAAFESGTPSFTNDMQRTAVSRRLVATTGAQAALFQPVLRGTEAVGVVVLVWRHRLRRLSDHTRRSVALLASEAAVAMERADQLSAAVLLAQKDPLTGLANRRSWDGEAGRAVARRQRSGEALTIAIIDLDHFKDFNDAHGHHRGDQLLTDAAEAWAETLRTSDLLARWGGEEFAVLLPGCEEPGASRVLERLRDATPEGITCSVGAVSVGPEESLDAAMRRADRALYEAKARGRDRLTFASAA
jgi:diguanylate cyclase (GGDEF)-like protein